ncbi:transcriptional regulator [Cupriavidus basilensis]|uniref:Transcriptional regulator n=1 Tax=Cupriavidus basilensis TaxID=68895 RepID=A0ABT6AUA5_9BURK|nr:GNAT family N-acetyltransferase [Cupriavidus basilensis]MDF3836213.1 transcriptional regulator [Cupriavidus basilensis]
MKPFVDYEFMDLRSFDDEALFFALMGRFFASPRVRRDCGGYPLNDGPLYRWFVALRRADRRVAGFISIEEQPDVVRIRDGYVRPEARGRGLFGELRRRVLIHIEALGVSATTRVPEPSVRYFEPHGFCIRSTRGQWVMLEKAAHVSCHAE